MKKTVNVNIGSVAFTVDEDAYAVLRNYLADISSRLGDEERAEVLEDVEMRISDILRENLSMPGQVVDLPLVNRTIAVIGRADCFGERRGAAPFPAEECPRKLYRSRTQRAIAGICGGLAEYMNWDVTLVRIATLLLMCFGGLSLWVYIILWIVIPEQPAGASRCREDHRKNARP